ncbi:MAG: 50S ribosomal protein L23 [Cyanobium sp. MAG06]|nr:50S ribosomal protein L23 [Cyanobium sp. MAG06]
MKKITNTTQEATEKKRESLILSAHLTEKASGMSNNNVYTLTVTGNANKTELLKEINSNYKVKPIKINIINLPGKKVLVRGRIGEKAGKKKALVFLKKGDTINLTK